MLTSFSELAGIKIESLSLKEYINFKDENPDCIIMFQLGGFYETLFEDAKIFSDITGCALGMRNFKPKIQIQEAGIPKDSLNCYLKKLLSNGLKVCICKEFCDEYGKHYRELTRKYTAGTILEDEFLESNENNYLMAIYFDNDNYNIAYADVSTGQLYKTVCDGKQYKTETDKIYPNEILISNTQEKIFKKLISKYNTTILDEKYFKNKIEDVIDKYCKATQKEYNSKLDKIIEYKPSSFMTLDEVTRKNLELTRTNYLMKKRGSILWFLNYTKTPMGIRLLKKFLNEPLLSKKDIEERLCAVGELTENPKIIDNIQNILVQFSDILRLCSKLSNVTVMPKDLINLSRNTLLLGELKEILHGLKSRLFKIHISKLNKVLKLANTINKAIKKDCLNDLKSGGIINEGYSSELDFLKDELNKIYKDIDNYAISQKKKLNTDYLEIKYSSAIGYYIEILSRDSLKIPKEYYKKASTNKLLRFSTDKLCSFQEDINSLQYKINQLEYDKFKNIRLLSSEFIDEIRILAHDVALIDVIASYAKCACENNLVKPEFRGENIFIKNGYHPSLIKLNNEIIKNDTDLKQASMMVLTGANMSGKSTYLKYNALICLLAQIGSFVPAQEAKLPVIDKIFFRQSSSDDIINNNSSFMVEMNDLKYILDNMTDFSLVLLDEPAKSTNAKESGAIARAYCEYILNKYMVKTIVATHNFELTKLENKYPSKVQNYVIGSDSGIFSRKIKRGVINKSYAIDTAILADRKSVV